MIGKDPLGILTTPENGQQKEQQTTGDPLGILKKKESTSPAGSDSSAPVEQPSTPSAQPGASEPVTPEIQKAAQNLKTPTERKAETNTAYADLLKANQAMNEAFKDNEPLAPIPTNKRLQQLKAQKQLNDAVLKIANTQPKPANVQAAKLVQDVAEGNSKSASIVKDFMQAADDPGGAINQSMSSFNKGFLSTITAIPKGIAIMAKPIDDLLGTNGGKPIEEYATYQLGQWIDEKAAEWGVGATNPDHATNFWTNGIPQAFGNVAAIALTGGRGLIAEEGLVATTTSQEIVSALKSPAASVGGVSVGVPEFEAAKQAGKSDEEAFNVFLKNYFVGLTDVAPVSRAFNRINKLSGGQLSQFIAAGLPGGLEEATQETVQQILTNRIAQGSYDPGRDLFQDVAQSGGAGFFVGFILPGIAGAMDSMTDTQRTDTQRSLNDLFNLLKARNTLTTQDLNTSEVIDLEMKDMNPDSQQSIQQAAATIQNKIDNASTIRENQGPVSQEGVLGKEGQTDRSGHVQQDQIGTPGEAHGETVQQTQGGETQAPGQENVKPRYRVRGEVAQQEQTTTEPVVPGTQQTKLGARIEASNEPAPIKESVKGRDMYIPRGVISTNEEAGKILDQWNDTEFAERAIRDTSNEMPGGTRGALAANLYQQYKQQAESTTDAGEKAQMYDKAADIAVWAAQNLTKQGQETAIAGKIWKSITSNEDLLTIALEKSVKRAQQQVIQPIQQDVQTSKVQFNQEVERIIRERVTTGVETQLQRAKLITKEQKQKISDALDKWKIKTPKGTAMATTIIPQVWNGGIEAVKRAVLAGADIANAIQAGIDYIRQNHKGEFNEQDFRSQLEPVVTQLVNPEKHAKQTKIERAIASVEKSISEYERRIKEKDFSTNKSESVTSEKLNELRKKREGLRKQYQSLKREQLKSEDINPDNIRTPKVRGSRKQNLIHDLVEEYNKEGKISDDRFEEIYAKQLGAKQLSTEDRQKIRGLAKIIGDTEKFKEEVKKNFTKKNIKQYEKLLRRAQDANSDLQKYAQANPSTVWDTLSTIMQGNLLAPISIMRNIYSNAVYQPLRFSSTAFGSIIDTAITELAKTDLLGKSFGDIVGRERTISLVGLNKGYFPGGWNGLMEGLYQMKTGARVDENKIREVNPQFDPTKAWKRWAEKDRTLGQKVNDAIEGTLGVPAEAMFRLLNLGDKPFRRAAELARGFELAELQGLKGEDALKFVLFADENTAQEMDKAGKQATFQDESQAAKIIQNGIFTILRHLPGPLKVIAKSQIPFVRTPINILAETMDYALPALTMLRGIQNISQGNKRTGSIQIGKAITGFMIYQVAKWLLQSGLMTWDDNDEGKRAERHSIQYDTENPNSINVEAIGRGLAGQGFKAKDGDAWIDYKNIGVLGMLLQIRANSFHQRQKEGVPESDLWHQMFVDVGMDGVKTIASAFDQSFLQGTNTLIQAIQDPEGYNGQKWLLNTTEALTSIAIPRTITSISQASDEVIRDTRDKDNWTAMMNVFKKNLFQGDKLAARVNLWGEKITGNPEGRNRMIYYLFDVTRFKNVDTDSFKYKLYQKWKEDKFNDEWLPAMPKRTVSVKGIQVPLTNEEYEQLATEVGTSRAHKVGAYFSRRNQERINLDDVRQRYTDGYNHGRRKFMMNRGWNMWSKQKLQALVDFRKK